MAGRVGPHLRQVWPAAPLAGLGGLGFAAAFRFQDIGWPVMIAALAGTGARLVVALPSPETETETEAVGDAEAEADDRGSWLAGLAALAVVVVGGVLALRASPVALAEGLREQQRLLQVALPAPSDAELLAVPYLYTVVAAFLGAAAWSGGRTGRRPAPVPLIPLAPSFAVLVAGLMFGGLDGLARATWVAPAWAAVALCSVCSVTGMWRSGATSRSQNGRVARAMVTAAVVAIVAVPVSEVLPARGDDGRVRLPRSAAPQPQDGQGNPLARVTALQKGPNDLMFTADISAPLEHWRLVVLDSYDGESWEHAADDYRVAGRHLPGEPDPPPIEPGSVTDVDATVELAAERDGTTGDAPWGRWLPVADRATELAVDGVLFDAAGGTAVVDAGRPLPDRYDTTGEIRQPDDGALPGDHAAGDAEARTARRVPDDVPDAAACRQTDPDGTRPVGCALRQLARSVVETADGDYARAVAIQSQLMDDDHFRLVVNDPGGGHTVRHLDDLVAEGIDGDDDPAYGSVEQFVAAYALVARMVGLPSRVGVGFRGELSPGRHQVRAHDAAAWVEVKFAGVGWTVFDPAPEPGVYAPTPDEQTTPEDETPETVAPLPQDSEGGRVTGDAGDGAADEDAAATARRWAAWALLVVLVVGVPVAVAAPGVLRWRRRARRRGASRRGRALPPARVAGAWQAALDELRLAGVEVTDTRAVSDLVDTGRARLGGVADPLVPLGTLANRSRFAATGVSDADADAAWMLSDAFVTARRQGRDLRQRVRQYVGLAETSERRHRVSL